MRLQLMAGVWALAVLGVHAQSKPTYQGKSVEEWFGLAVGDLDPEYRKNALEAVVRFGASAVPVLESALQRSSDPRTITTATTALARVGPEGRAVVGREFGSKRRDLIPALIEGVGESGEAGRFFVPHLQNAANYPELFLAASRVLGKLGVDVPEVGVTSAREQTWEAFGTTVTMKPPNCFAEAVFPLLRVEVKTSGTNRVIGGRLVFKSALGDGPGGGKWYYVPLRSVPVDPGAPLRLEAKLPKPKLGVTAIHYFAEIQTTEGVVRTTEIVGTAKRSAEGCTQSGLFPADEGPRGAIRIDPYVPKKKGR